MIEIIISIVAVVAVLVAYWLGQRHASSAIKQLEAKIEVVSSAIRETNQEVGNLYNTIQNQSVESMKASQVQMDDIRNLLNGAIGGIPNQVESPLHPKVGHGLRGNPPRKEQ